MQWLERWRRRGAERGRLRPEERQEPLALPREREVDMGMVRSLSALLAAIEDVTPREAVLYLEGINMAPDVRAFLEARRAEEIRPVVRGTIWPRPAKYHLPLAGSNLAVLRELAERHAEPEVCDHLVVYRGDQVLLQAYDAGASHVYVSDDLPEAVVDALRARLGPA